MTALEIAREMGYHGLFDLLAPVIRHPLPPATVDRLQQQLNYLLKDLINDEPLFRQLRVPELSVLTELENPVMWFPVSKARARLWVS
jgi:hypothetical protein